MAIIVTAADLPECHEYPTDEAASFGWGVYTTSYEMPHDRILIAHTVPFGDLRPHKLCLSCWCNPVEDEDQPFAIIHNSADRREEIECGTVSIH